MSIQSLRAELSRNLCIPEQKLIRMKKAEMLNLLVDTLEHEVGCEPPDGTEDLVASVIKSLLTCDIEKKLIMRGLKLRGSEVDKMQTLSQHLLIDASKELINANKDSFEDRGIYQTEITSLTKRSDELIIQLGIINTILQSE